MSMRMWIGFTGVLLVVGGLTLTLPGCGSDQNAGGGAGATAAPANPAPPGTPPEEAVPPGKAK